MSATRKWSYEEVSKHNSAKDCWVIIHGSVYDLTDFLREHPGGQKPILHEAGRDGTKAFSQFHPKDIIKQMLSSDKLMGVIDVSSKPVSVENTNDVKHATRKAVQGKPPVSAMLNSFDFEAVARATLTPEAWAYYSSGSDDELTLRENRSVFQRVWLLPRILVDVTNIDLRTSMLGTPTNLPIYMTSCALGKLGHPEGEIVLTRAASSQGVIQMMPTLASCSLDEMMDAAAPGQPQWFQLYVNKDRAVTERIVRHAEKRGVRGLFITVDAPQLGRREKDMRVKFSADAPDVQSTNATEKSRIDRNRGAARAISSFIDPGLNWSDLAWFRSITSLPIVLKGVQTGADAVRAARSGLVQGVVVSNHGGRQLDTARSGLEALAEIVADLRSAGFKVGGNRYTQGPPQFIGEVPGTTDPARGGLHAYAAADVNALNAPRGFEVLVDGGFRRGADVFKALAMGASGVGLGRPMLYAMSAYGQEGVDRALEVFADEMVMVMRLMGTPGIKDISGDLVDTRDLTSHVGPPLRDYLSEHVYEPLQPAAVSSKSKSKL